MSQLPLRRSTFIAAFLVLAACGESKEEAKAADASAQFAASADALAAKLETGQVPPATDPAVKAYQAQTASALQTLGTPALPVDGFKSFEALCGKGARVVGAYVSAGTAQLPEAQRPAAMERNITERIDLVFTPLLFSAHCSAAHMPFLAETVGDDVGSKAAALGQIRGGAFGQALGLMQMAGATELDLGRRRQLLDLLTRDAGNFAIALSPAQREQLSETATELRSRLPEELRAQVDGIKSAFASAPCGPLCKM